MDRRQFLFGTAAVSAAAAVGAAPRLAGAAPFKPVFGYTPGCLAPDFAWPDQFGRTWHLRDFRGAWTLLDFTAVWCPPCNVANLQMENLHAFLEAHGVALNIVELLVQGPATSQGLLPATPTDAERWAARSGNPGQIVLHPANSQDLSMLAMVTAYYTANALEVFFPDFVLLDRNGIIRYHVPAGTDMTTYDPNDYTPILDVINPAFGTVAIPVNPPSVATRPFSDSVVLQSLLVSSTLPSRVEERAVDTLEQLQSAMAARHFDNALTKAQDVADVLRDAAADPGLQKIADAIAVTLAGYPGA